MKHAAWGLRLIDLAAWITLGVAVVAARKPVSVTGPAPITSLRTFGWGDWKTILKRTALEVRHDKLTTVAGGVTFQALLSIFPTLAAFVSLYGLFFDVSDVSRQLAHMSRVMPPGVVDLIGDQMLRLATARSSDLSFALGLSLIIAVWSANAGMGAMFVGLNAAYGLAERRAWWKRTLITLACTTTGLGVLIILAAVTAALPAWLQANSLQIAGLPWLVLSWIMVLAAITTALAGLYRFGPSHVAPAWRTYWPGAVAAAFIWIGGSVAFSAYVGQFGHYEKTYGSLGAIIGFMVWIWFSALAILAGAELNAEIERQAATPA